MGYRYCPAGINPPGSALICRTIESSPTSYRVSWEDRSQYIHVTRDGVGLLGTKGFRSARCNAPIREGKWYMEVKIERGGGDHVLDGRRYGSHVRLGWGRREASLNAPVGLDGYSYGIRDKTGEKVTLSRPKPYGRPFKTGDVIGMYISLPPLRKPSKKDPLDPAHIKRERIAIDFKGQETFEALEYPQTKEMITLTEQLTKYSKSESLPSTATTTKKAATGKLPERGPAPAPRKPEDQSRPLPTLPQSRIAFFVNGECQGSAYEEIYDFLPLRETEASKKREKRRAREGVKEHRANPFDDGTLGYYPFITLFNDAAVRLNSGPNFEFAPPPDIDATLDGLPIDNAPQTWRPACDRYAEFMAEQWALDKTEEEEAKAEQLKNAVQENIESEKKIQRAKKKTQADSRKRPKKGHVERSVSVAEEMRPSSPANPSPLRQSTAYEPQPSPENRDELMQIPDQVPQEYTAPDYLSPTQNDHMHMPHLPSYQLPPTLEFGNPGSTHRVADYHYPPPEPNRERMYMPQLPNPPQFTKFSSPIPQSSQLDSPFYTAPHSSSSFSSGSNTLYTTTSLPEPRYTPNPENDTSTPRYEQEESDPEEYRQ